MSVSLGPVRPSVASAALDDSARAQDATSSGTVARAAAHYDRVEKSAKSVADVRAAAIRFGAPASPENALGSAWDWTSREAGAVVDAVGSFDAAHQHVVTRVVGGAQALGGAAETLAGAMVSGIGGALTATGAGAVPGIPALVGGGALTLNGLDNAQVGVRTAITGGSHQTAIAYLAGAAARRFGVSDEGAQRVTAVADVAQGVVGGLPAVGLTIVRAGATDAAKVAADAGVAAKADVATAALRNGERWSSGDPPVDLVHNFQGEIGRKRGILGAKGFHHSPNDGLHPNSTVGQITVGPNAHGVYDAKVTIADPKTGQLHTKFSTMFPATMSRHDVVRSIQRAYTNAKERNGASFVGPSGRGFDVKGYIVSVEGKLHIRSAYPVYKD